MAENDPSPVAQEPRAPATQEMLDVANRFINEIRAKDAQLADRLVMLTADHADPLRANQTVFRHSVAYAVENAEKTLGHQLPLSDTARADMTHLAGSAPGLENGRMIALLQSTPTINNPDLVREIRLQGHEIGRQSNQSTDQINERLDHLEHAVRQADRAPPLAPAPEAPKANPSTAPSGSQADQPERSQGNSDSHTAAGQDRRSQNGRDEAQRTQEEARAQAAAQQGQVHARPANLVDHINGVVRNVAGGGASAPWDSAPQPFAGRLTAFEATLGEARDHAALRNAERAGRAALDAMQGFQAGDGATIMNRIAAAARSDPEGMAGVLTGMRDGGRYQDLRQQFNTALVEEKGFANAYDKAAEALAKYGEARTGVEQIIARRPDAANITAKFERLDAEIGEKAESTPSRREGKTSLEDISKQAAEIIQKAVEAVKSYFTPKGPENTNRPGPSPS
jgi:hypothetical protein